MRAAEPARVPVLFSHAEGPRETHRTGRNMEEDLRGAELGVHSDHLNQKTYGFPNLSLKS